ncbi:MAG: hypothetical protein IPM64_00875 [Phycisphaerales bacterium]|nr:hypothetical protein [Phycisphaerales bacterium]
MFSNPMYDVVMKAMNEMLRSGAIPASTGLINAMNMAGQKLAVTWGQMAASTAPVWRAIPYVNPVRGMALPMGSAGGTSSAATVQGLAALGIAGVAIAVAAGVWVALGAPYYQAVERARERGFMSGFSQGFVTGVLNWGWHHAASRFGMRRVVLRNHFVPEADRVEAVAHNEGLFVGFALGMGGKAEGKKAFRIALRKLAGRVDDAPWSRDADEARLQQVDYVISLASAGVKHGLIVGK